MSDDRSLKTSLPVPYAPTASYVSAMSVSAVGTASCILSAAVVTGPEFIPTVCDRRWETGDEIVRRVLDVST